MTARWPSPGGRDGLRTTLLALVLVLSPAPWTPRSSIAAGQESTPDQPAQPAQPPQTSCTICHADAELFDTDSLEILRDHAGSVHAGAGISCHDCHGGDPDPTLGDDIFGAMNEDFSSNPYVGVPDRVDIATACGSCHSEATTMRAFDPDLPTDQEALYRESRHGLELAGGNTRAATCTDCHDVHAMRAIDDSQARVHPTHVAETCGACHSSEEVMDGATTASGDRMPTDQESLWNASVHATALLDRGDLSAPTCNDCHGDHGPPEGVESAGSACGQCHGRQASLVRASPKHDLLLDHDEMLADAGDEGCAACHEPPDPQTELTGIRRLGECSSCHRAHAVIRPSIAMLSPLPETPCAFCHEPPTPTGDPVIDPSVSGSSYESTLTALLNGAPADLDPEQRFDWLVDQALSLPFHTTDVGNGEPLALRPEFQNLFQAFRIGKTHFQSEDVLTGEVTTQQVVGCADCHAPEPTLGEAVGYRQAVEIQTKVRELSTLVARAERTLLRAKRGGVETGDAQTAIEQAIDAQIEVETLIHTFSADPEGELAAVHQEGVEQAERALAESLDALDELTRRRRGLLLSLFFVALVLVGLGLEIRRRSAG